MVEGLLRGKASWSCILQLLIVDVFQVIVERTVMNGSNLGNCLVEDEIGLVIHTHELALEDTLVLGGHAYPPADVL
jgi:hypothetical protein